LDKLQRAFEEAFGIPFSTCPLPECDLFPMGEDQIEDELLFGSEEALKTPILRAGDIDTFMVKCLPGFFMVGFWGHGVNSYAFYYSRIDERSKIYFRLPYGGAYMNNEEAARQIARFVPAFFAYEAQLKGHGYELIAVDSMWEGWYRMKDREGKETEYGKSLLEYPNFSEVLGIPF
jgi:hypothetical protein